MVKLNLNSSIKCKHEELINKLDEAFKSYIASPNYNDSKQWGMFCDLMDEVGEIAGTGSNKVNHK